MTHVFAALLVLHGLIHLIGVAAAFGLADLPQLTQPIRPAIGVLWLLSAVLFLATAVALYLWPRWWWAIGALALVLSVLPLALSWPDTRAGVGMSLLVGCGVIIGALVSGPGSLRARYERDARGVLENVASPAPILTDADIAGLPAPVQRYLHFTGAVGKPRVRTYTARMHGRIRSGPDARWMPFRAAQVSGVEPLSRLFYMDASMTGVPVQGLHRYTGDAASMRVLIGGLVPVAEMAGAEMTRAETVTLLNDLCIFAPGALTSPALRWAPVDHRRARATLTHAGHTVDAELVFDDEGALVDFWSDDRLAASPDGSHMVPMRWSTPLRDYRQFGQLRLASHGEGRWHAPDGEYVYIDLTIDEVQYGTAWATAMRR